jgi:hypothetical protein
VQIFLPVINFSDHTDFEAFTNSFIARNQIPRVFLNSDHSRETIGIPEKFQDTFVQEFLSTFEAKILQLNNGLLENSAFNPMEEIPQFGDFDFTNESHREVNFLSTHSEKRAGLSIDEIYKNAVEIDGTPIVRFNMIMKTLMPTYNAAPKHVRKQIKDSVRDYLVSKLGSETKLDQCSMVASSCGQTFLTYGIPRHLYYDFREWAVKDLRRRFGTDVIKIQSWE